ncbi:MarR family transcriptional regulator [Natrialba sp. PRR66]|uniref:helix-turn-helix transcriptional regulator n=1 Tax=Natrialba sp. PRR66 TaxID=3098146 RepID=UPI002B1D8240|nr:MarR family transcriptional regulator [Natrialba sp. PRR66]
MKTRLRLGSRLVAATLVVAAFLLCLQLLHPSPVVVSVSGSSSETTRLPGFFAYRDVGVVLVTSFVLGACSTYLFLDWRAETERSPAEDDAEPTSKQLEVEDEPGSVTISDELLERRHREWDTIAPKLSQAERDIYEQIPDADGVLEQRLIVAQTDHSKATVSRKLDRLEGKNLVERRRRGMGKVVFLR